MDDKPSPALREAYDLLDYFYHLDEGTDQERALNARYFRDSVYRMVIIEFHLAIESLLKDLIYKALPVRRAFTAKENRAYVDRLNFWAAANLAARVGIVNKSGLDELLRLNQIRNRSAHDWLLRGYTITKKTRQGSGRRQYKIEFNGKHLFRSEVMKDEFIPHYGDLYLEFYAVNNGLRWKRRYINY